MAFDDYLSVANEKLQTQKNWRDNHLRPQVEFMRPGLSVFRTEDRFDADWAQDISARVGFKLAVAEVPKRRHTKVQIPLTLSEQALENAAEFCRKHYQDDFAEFGYTLEHG